MIRIRKCEPELVEEMCNRLIGTDDAWSPDGEYWGAWLDGALVGFSGLKPSQQITDCVFLHCSGVEPEARGSRIQRKMIRVRCNWARKNGFMYARTYTIPSNPASSRSLIACGFRPYWPNYAWAGNVCYWFKTL